MIAGIQQTNSPETNNTYTYKNLVQKLYDSKL